MLGYLAESSQSRMHVPVKKTSLYRKYFSKWPCFSASSCAALRAPRASPLSTRDSFQALHRGGMLFGSSCIFYLLPTLIRTFAAVPSCSLSGVSPCWPIQVQHDAIES